MPNTQGFYKVVETVLRQNDKIHCSFALLKGPGEQVPILSSSVRHATSC